MEKRVEGWPSVRLPSVPVKRHTSLHTQEGKKKFIPPAIYFRINSHCQHLKKGILRGLCEISLHLSTILKSVLSSTFLYHLFFHPTYSDQYFGIPGRKHSLRLWWALLLHLEQTGKQLALPIPSFSNDYLLLLFLRWGTRKMTPNKS